MAVSSAPIRPTAKERYSHLKELRQVALDRARQCADVTIPALLPLEDSTGTEEFYSPFQSVGARGVNNLAAKLLLALFPPGSSFFRLSPDDQLEAQLSAMEDQEQTDTRAKVEEVLGKIERTVMRRMEKTGSRAKISESLKHLLVVGDVLVQVLDDGRLRYYPLPQYVVKRDREGNLLEIVVKETLAKVSLPDAAQEIVMAYDEKHPEDASGQKNVDLFTRVTRDNRKWSVFQEVCGEEIPKTRGTYPLEKTPWIACRWSSVDGDDYGRSFVYEHLGDLQSLESLSQSLIESSAIMAKTIFLADEGGVTEKSAVARASNGAVIDGRASDITTLRAENVQELNVAFQNATALKKDLEQVFQLMSGIQRDAERVTAEEIRTLANELEQTLGGTYSLLAEELQLPLVRRIMVQMQKSKALPPLPEKNVAPQIITGLAALGRTSDLQRIDALVQGVETLFGPEAVNEWVDAGAYLTRRATALGIDVKGMIRSQDQVDQQRAQKAQQQTAQALAPEAMKMHADQQQQAAQQPTNSAGASS